MKVIPTSDLIEMLKQCDEKLLSLKNMEHIFNRYGDDYYIIDGSFDLSNENEERKRLLKFWNREVNNG